MGVVVAGAHTGWREGGEGERRGGGGGVEWYETRLRARAVSPIEFERVSINLEAVA